MITAERKPIDEIRAMIAPYRKVLVLGCGSCVAECAAGGEKETGMLASALRMANKMDGKEVLVQEKTLDRQCVKDFVILLDDIIDQYDAVLSLGCGAGVQAVAEMFSEPAWGAGTACSTTSEGCAPWRGAPNSFSTAPAGDPGKGSVRSIPRFLVPGRPSSTGSTGSDPWTAWSRFTLPRTGRENRAGGRERSGGRISRGERREPFKESS